MKRSKRLKKIILLEESDIIESSDSDTIVVTKNILREFSERDTVAVCIEFMRALPSLVLNGKTVKEWFRYRNTSLWWFIYPVLFPKIEGCISFTEQFQNMLDKLDPASVEIKGFYDKIDLITQICSRRNIKVSTSFITMIQILVSALKQRLRIWRINLIAKQKEKRRVTLARHFDREKINVNEGCVIFVSPNNLRRTIYDWRTGKTVRGEHVVHKALEEIKEKAELLCIDVDYSLKGDLENLKDRMLDKDQLWVPLEVFMTDAVKSGCQESIKNFTSNIRTLLRDEGFRQSLIYDDIKLWKTVNSYFETLLADAYIPTYIKCIETARSLLALFKPISIFLIYETGPYSKAFIVSASEFRIRSTAIQYASIHEGADDYAHNDLAINNSDFGCPIPTTMLVYGDFAKKILTEKFSYPSERVLVIGHPEYDDINPDVLGSYKNEIIKDLHLGSSKKNILVATGKFQKKHGYGDFDERMVKALAENLGSRNDLQIILKPHPEEDTSVYKSIIEEYKASNFKIVDYPIQRLPLVCDVFVTITSTAGIEALVLDKPVIIVQFTNNPDYLLYVESGAALGAKLEELPSAVLSVIEDKKLNEILKQKRLEYVRFHFNFPSKDINKKIADIVIHGN